MSKLLTPLLLIMALANVGLEPSDASAATPGLDRITVEITPVHADVALGDTIEMRVTITNSSEVARDDLVAHIDVTSPDRGGSVDPEDWTATLSKPVGQLAAGASATIDWSIQPISPGTFQVYAVALAADADDVAGSNVLMVSVTDQRSLNPQGVLPVVLIVPAAVGALFFSRLRRNRA